MNAHYRALTKTACVVGIIAIIIAIASVWPPILGYTALLLMTTLFLGMIYASFRMYEDQKEWDKRR